MLVQYIPALVSRYGGHNYVSPTVLMEATFESFAVHLLSIVGNDSQGSN
jgi:hypothetical protein